MKADSKPPDQTQECKLSKTYEDNKHQTDKSPKETFSTTYTNTIIDQSLPQVKKEVPLTVSVYSIISSFTKSCSKYNFLITEQTPSSCTAYNTKTCSFRSLITCCIGKKVKLNITSIRLIITSNTSTTSRVVFVKGQQGDLNLLNKVINHFVSSLEVDVIKYCKMQYQKVIEEDEEELAVTCKNESYSYYQFYKILSCEAYTLGKSITEFCESFNSQYRNPVESACLLPQPLLSIQGVVERTIDSLFCNYNYGKKNTEKVMIYCRPAVEKYIYTKLISGLMNIYKAKFEREDREIEEEKERFRDWKVEDVFGFFHIPDKLMVDDGKIYVLPAEVLAKINEFVTPAEKVNCILNFEASLKSEIVASWKGAGIDEESCILIEIYCILISPVKNIRAEIGLLTDYLRDKTEEEKLSVFNIEKALSFLRR